MSEPMPIKDLPGYLKSVKGKSIDPENAPVVDMGTIVQKPRLFRNALALSFFLAVFSLSIGIMNYIGINKVEKIVVVLNDGEQNIESVKEIMEFNGAKIISIEESSEGAFEVKVSLRKRNIKKFIDSLKDKKEIKDAWVNSDLKTL